MFMILYFFFFKLALVPLSISPNINSVPETLLSILEIKTVTLLAMTNKTPIITIISAYFPYSIPPSFYCIFFIISKIYVLNIMIVICMKCIIFMTSIGIGVIPNTE